MQVSLKVRFDATKERFEKFDRNKYLLYLIGGRDDNSLKEISQILSKHFGVPISRIKFLQQQPITKDLIFEVD
jgi:hypothetical protein